MRELHNDDYVIFINEDGHRRHAIVTTVWPQMGGGTLPPGCNIAYFDEADGGPEPVQHSSVPHRSHVEGASGFYWLWPHEDPRAATHGPFADLKAALSDAEVPKV